MKQKASVEELIPVNTLILSDIHLGSEVSRADKALEVLQIYSFKRLILLGDIFDDLNFKRLKKGHWNFLSYVRKLSNPKRNIEVIWVEGNHDEGLSEIMALMIGIDILKEYIWEVNGKKILAIHGHQFDRFLNENVIISKIASFIYDRLQRLGSENQTIARYIKKKSKGWLRLAGKMAHGAIDYAKNKNVNVVICGHTHIQTDEPIEAKSIQYYNTGCFTDVPSSFIVITEEGEINTKYI